MHHGNDWDRREAHHLTRELEKHHPNFAHIRAELARDAHAVSPKEFHHLANLLKHDLHKDHHHLTEETHHGKVTHLNFAGHDIYGHGHHGHHGHHPEHLLHHGTHKGFEQPNHAGGSHHNHDGEAHRGRAAHHHRDAFAPVPNPVPRPEGIGKTPPTETKDSENPNAPPILI